MFGPADEPLCLAVSTCRETTLEGMLAACRPADPTRGTPEGERDCRNFPVAVGIDFHFGNLGVFRGMVCETGYPQQDSGVGCADAYGQRVKWTGATWVVIGPNSWFFRGYCPPALLEPCAGPSPAPSPGACGEWKDCGGPELVGDGWAGYGRYWGCCLDGAGREGRFAAVVRAAWEAVVSDRALVRDGRVLDGEAYRAALVAAIQARGLCAEKGPLEDEIRVRRGTGYAEMYDVITGAGLAWQGLAALCRR